MLELFEARQISPPSQESTLDEIDHLDSELFLHFSDKFKVQTSLTRTMVSFQANKTKPVYRWYKYKEAFSASLVEHFINMYNITRGKLLDPFAGSGTALFAVSAAGIDAAGIELLPVAQQVISTRICLEREFTAKDVAALSRWATMCPWEQSDTREILSQVPITYGAYPAQTLDAIEHYLAASKQETELVQSVLLFALMCVLESVSFTRKDGQYLRWDHRSGRRQGAKPFNKGRILHLRQAISSKLNEILLDLHNVNNDLGLFPTVHNPGSIRLIGGSCLDILPTLPNGDYDIIFTSPPYCNRYDYTRTYALELALLGMNEQD
ncbi:MAG: DNA modification methylase, partial [Chloroflexi bacterium CG07_land_8_20_14_0_80_51_10]